MAVLKITTIDRQSNVNDGLGGKIVFNRSSDNTAIWDVQATGTGVKPTLEFKLAGTVDSVLTLSEGSVTIPTIATTTMTATGTVTFTGPTYLSGTKFRAYLASNTAWGSLPFKIPFNTEVFDTNSEFNTSTNSFVVTRTGHYQLNATVRCITGTLAWTQGEMTIALWKNGSQFSVGVGNDEFKRQYTGNGRLGASVSGLYFLTAGDIVDVRCTYNSGAPAIAGGLVESSFSGFLVA